MSGSVEMKEGGIVIFDCVNVFKSNQWSKKNFKRLKFSNTSGVLE